VIVPTARFGVWESKLHCPRLEWPSAPWLRLSVREGAACRVCSSVASASARSSRSPDPVFRPWTGFKVKGFPSSLLGGTTGVLRPGSPCVVRPWPCEHRDDALRCIVVMRVARHADISVASLGWLRGGGSSGLAQSLGLLVCRLTARHKKVTLDGFRAMLVWASRGSPVPGDDAIGVLESRWGFTSPSSPAPQAGASLKHSVDLRVCGVWVAARRGCGDVSRASLSVVLPSSLAQRSRPSG